MKSVLFRGRSKALVSNPWVYGDLIHPHKASGGQWFIFPRNKPLTQGVPVIGRSIGQWTGFIDEVERPIFEGDIVHFQLSRYGHSEDRIFGVVQYDGGSYKLTDDLFLRDYVYSLGEFGTNQIRLFRVVGNAYDDKLSSFKDADNSDHDLYANLDLPDTVLLDHLMKDMEVDERWTD